MIVRGLTLGLEITSGLMWLYVWLNGKYVIKTGNRDDIAVARQIVGILLFVTMCATAGSMFNFAVNLPARLPAWMWLISMSYSTIFALGYTVVVHSRKKVSINWSDQMHKHLHLVQSERKAA